MDRRSKYWIQLAVVLALIWFGFRYFFHQTNERDASNLTVYTFDHGVYKLNNTVCDTNLLNKMKNKEYFVKGSIVTDLGTTYLYLNNPKEDFFSRDIYEKHTYEPWIFNTIYKHIRHDPSIGLIDLGANLGSMTLQVAKLGRPVISIEAAYQCAQHFCASILENSLENKVTVIHNAISKDHNDVPFVYPSKGEFALGFVEDRNIRKDFSNRFGNVHRNRVVPVKTVTLNDLLDLPEFNRIPKVLVKMDVQGFEHNAIAGADKFYQTGKLMGILMEWTWHRNKTTGDFLIKKFNEWNLEPFDCNEVLKDVSADLDKPCVKKDVKMSAFWMTDDILWLPKAP